MIRNYQLFKEKINYVIQNSSLDIGIVYFILKDIFFEIEKLYYAQLNKECLEEAQKIEKETESEKNNKTIKEE